MLKDMMSRDGVHSWKIRAIWFENEIAKPSLTRGGASPEFFRPVDTPRVAEDAETNGDVRNVYKMIARG
jgi:hypothetical protein